MNRTLVKSMFVRMRMHRTGVSSPSSTAVWMSSLWAVFLKISKMLLPSERSGVAVSPSVNRGLKKANTF